MNKFGAATIGALIGGGIGYLVGDYIAVNYMSKDDDLYLEELDELVGDVTKDYEILSRNQKKLETNHKKIERVNKKVKDYTQHFISQDRPELAALAAKYNEGIVVNTPAREGEEIEGLRDQVDDEEDLWLENESTDIDPDELNAAYIGISEKDPAIISVSEYANDDEYKHITLNYYDDDVVTDEDDKPINRPETFLGDDALVSFGVLSQDEDVVYVRNHEKKAMYEVVRLNKSYAAPAQPRRQALSRRAEEKRNEETADN